MQLTFENLWPLALLLALVPVWWARRTSLIEFRSRQLDVMVLLRAAALVLVVLAMMQPVLHRTGSWLSTVYLLDVSRSIAPRAVEDSIDWIESMEEAGVSENSRFVAFGGTANLVAQAPGLRTVPVADQAVSGAVDRSATDLQVAIERAVAALPPYHVPRVVLLSDGNATDGDVGSALQTLRLAGVRMHTRPTAARFAADSWLDAVHVPATVTAGSPFSAAIELYAQTATRGTLMVLDGDEVVASELVEMAAGATTVTLLPVLADAGPAVLDVVLRVEGDPNPANNLAQVSLFARAQAKVLYIEGRPDTSDYLAEALRDGGLDVTVVSPLRIPTRVAEFDEYAAVILSDVLPELLSPGSMAALTTYVEDLGGGFILAGGESVYGEEGYSESAIETIMPVWFKAEREPKDLVLIIALDKSYSMVGDKMALAKEASKAALRQLEDDQQFGLLAFDYHFYWPVPIQNATQKGRIEERISSIEASSPTNIYPALQDVFQSLQTTEAEVKHVILLSDGKTYEDDYEGLLTQMTDADITVSTVAVGDKADRQLLGNIAVWGKGRSYYIEDPTKVPEIFIDETQMAQGVTIEESGDVAPLVLKQVEAFAGLDMDTVPPLLGYVRTMAKENAEVVIATEDEDPLLVRWQYGLGRTVLFASDVKNRWSSRWLAWDGYGKFWTQLVRETMRQSDFREPGLQLVRRDGVATVGLDLIDARGRFQNAQRPTIEVVAADAAVTSVPLAQVGPGRYEAAFAAAEDEPLTIRWQGPDGRGVERALLPVRSDELRFRGPDEELLRRLATATGGRFEPSAAQMASADGQTVVRPTRLWPAMAAMALVFYLANMLLRRVRIFGELDEAS